MQISEQQQQVETSTSHVVTGKVHTLQHSLFQTKTHEYIIQLWHWGWSVSVLLLIKGRSSLSNTSHHTDLISGNGKWSLLPLTSGTYDNILAVVTISWEQIDPRGLSFIGQDCACMEQQALCHYHSCSASVPGSQPQHAQMSSTQPYHWTPRLQIHYMLFWEECVHRVSGIAMYHPSYLLQSSANEREVSAAIFFLCERQCNPFSFHSE